jgi:hypothetical protein
VIGGCGSGQAHQGFPFSSMVLFRKGTARFARGSDGVHNHSCTMVNLCCLSISLSSVLYSHGMNKLYHSRRDAPAPNAVADFRPRIIFDPVRQADDRFHLQSHQLGEESHTHADRRIQRQGTPADSVN